MAEEKILIKELIETALSDLEFQLISLSKKGHKNVWDQYCCDAMNMAVKTEREKRDIERAIEFLEELDMTKLSKAQLDGSDPILFRYKSQAPNYKTGNYDYEMQIIYDKDAQTIKLERKLIEGGKINGRGKTGRKNIKSN